MKKDGIEDAASTRELSKAAKLDGKAGELTDEELASYLLAKSMSGPIPSQFVEYKFSFENRLGKDAYMGIDGKDPKVVFEVARQILAKTYGVKIEGGMEVSDANFNKPLFEAVDKSPKTEPVRC